SDPKRQTAANCRKSWHRVCLYFFALVTNARACTTRDWIVKEDARFSKIPTRGNSLCKRHRPRPHSRQQKTTIARGIERTRKDPESGSSGRDASQGTVRRDIMLVLTRKLDEKIRIGKDIVITVVEVKGNRVRLGIEAPLSVPVVRGELLPITAEPAKQK